MKIEIGESLILSWLRHAKGCQIVQSNWKASVKSWDLMNEATIATLMTSSADFFKSKYGYDIYKNNTGVYQLIQQAEIDVIGIHFENDTKQIFAVDVAFHEAGLNYGSKDETVSRVVKKCLRTAMCLLGYFGVADGEIIFAAPKIHKAVSDLLAPSTAGMMDILQKHGLNFRVRVIGNEDFNEKILEPVVSATSLIADTSELFMRSLQMYNLFADKPKRKQIAPQSLQRKTENMSTPYIAPAELSGLEEMKIGVLVRSTLERMLPNGDISPEEIELMQTAEYSKKTFDIQFPLLLKSNGLSQKPSRYWAGPVSAYGESYYICSEWFEVPANNDRPYFMKWLELHACNREN